MVEAFGPQAAQTLGPYHCLLELVMDEGSALVRSEIAMRFGPLLQPSELRSAIQRYSSARGTVDPWIAHC